MVNRNTATLAALCFCAATTLLPSTVAQGIKKQLRLNENGTFKMVQFTDIHFGESEEDDTASTKLLGDVIDQEKPDLVIVSGDVVSGYAWPDDQPQGWTASAYTNFTKPLTARKAYWATTGGNHDEEGDIKNRTLLSELDRSFEYSLTLPNAANISHAFNYMLPVYDKDGKDIVFRLWFLDSGREECLGVGGWDCVRPDQVDWFRAEHNKIESSDPSKGKGFLFVHIPFDEYKSLFNDFYYHGTKGEPICCGSVNTGLFGALIEQKTVEWVSCGHDHDNDYWGTYQGINLAYGRKTGHGGYGPDGFPKGSRVFEVSTDPTYGIKTWIREEGGTIDNQTQALKRHLFDFSQSLCCAMDKPELVEHIEKVKHRNSQPQSGNLIM